MPFVHILKVTSVNSAFWLKNHWSSFDVLRRGTIGILSIPSIHIILHFLFRSMPETSSCESLNLGQKSRAFDKIFGETLDELSSFVAKHSIYTNVDPLLGFLYPYK